METILTYFTDFTDTQISQFKKLLPLYSEWNKKINVISRRDVDSLYIHHILHSLSIAAFMSFEKNASIIDIGCGGGFPSIPLAIFFPEISFYLVDSIAKKLTVVEAIAKELGLHNITIKHGRVEDIKNKQFDFCISRGVTNLKQLWQWSKPLIKKGGHHAILNGLICLKGGDLHQEIADSCTRPTLISIKQYFQESFFDEKYIIYLNK